VRTTIIDRHSGSVVAPARRLCTTSVHGAAAARGVSAWCSGWRDLRRPRMHGARLRDARGPPTAADRA
jgi:hypothetical protein